MNRKEVNREKRPAARRLEGLLIRRECRDYRDQTITRTRNAGERTRTSLSAGEVATTTVDRILEKNQSVGAAKNLDRLPMHRYRGFRGLMKMMRNEGEHMRPSLDAVESTTTTVVTAIKTTVFAATTMAVIDAMIIVAISAMKAVGAVNVTTAINATPPEAIDASL